MQDVVQAHLAFLATTANLTKPHAQTLTLSLIGKVQACKALQDYTDSLRKHSNNDDYYEWNLISVL